MTLVLRQLVRSRRLQSMGVLAWLLLVLNVFAAPSPGVPEGTRSRHPHAMAAGAQVHHDMQAVAAHADCSVPNGCCGTPAAHACQCPAMSGSMLTSTAPVVPGAVALAVVYARAPGSRAPSPATVAPLRPPTA